MTNTNHRQPTDEYLTGLAYATTNGSHNLQTLFGWYATGNGINNQEAAQ